jgi:mannosyltransferase OCH1-like enzyme|tara:strand:- start:192 stop:824 length:633 start_codon:yes stop_codon:yes gene_type:complete
MFPKIFHQTWKTENLRENEKKISDIIKKKYSDYKYILWTDEMIYDFIKNNYPQYNDFFNKLSKIQQIDIVRYFWMYHYGGVYSDLDILYIKKINYTNFSGIIFIEREWTHPKNEKITTSVHNAIFASESKHPLWMTIINEIIIKYNKGERNVFNLTGPNSISEIITRLDLTSKYNNICILPGIYLYQKGNSKTSSPNTCYVQHLCYGSWK